MSGYNIKKKIEGKDIKIAEEEEDSWHKKVSQKEKNPDVSHETSGKSRHGGYIIFPLPNITFPSRSEEIIIIVSLPNITFPPHSGGNTIIFSLLG